MIKPPSNFVHIQLNSTEEFKILGMFKKRKKGGRKKNKEDDGAGLE